MEDATGPESWISGTCVLLRIDSDRHSTLCATTCRSEIPSLHSFRTLFVDDLVLCISLRKQY